MSVGSDCIQHKHRIKTAEVGLFIEVREEETRVCVTVIVIVKLSHFVCCTVTGASRVKMKSFNVSVCWL